MPTAKRTHCNVHPAVIHDGDSYERHYTDTHEQVADGEVSDQHGRHGVEVLGGCHNPDDQNITYARTHAHTHTQAGGRSALTHGEVDS